MTELTSYIKALINNFPFMEGHFLSKYFRLITWHLKQASVLLEIWRLVIFWIETQT